VGRMKGPGAPFTGFDMRTSGLIHVSISGGSRHLRGSFNCKVVVVVASTTINRSG